MANTLSMPMRAVRALDAAVGRDEAAAALLPDGDDRGNFVQSLARGLAAIRSFDADHPAQTLSDVARRAGLSRAAARRILLTLVGLGYAQFDGRHFRLRPAVLELGFAYLQGTGLWGVAQPYMVSLVEQIHESCSAAVLDGRDIVYVARVPTQTRIMSVSIGLGTRLPAHLTSMGRVLLAAQPDAVIDAHLASLVPMASRTERTLTDPAALRAALLAIRTDGYAIVDQELEHGLRSVAVPLRGAGDAVVAALNVGMQASRVPFDALHRRILPALRRTATDISRALGSNA